MYHFRTVEREYTTSPRRSVVSATSTSCPDSEASAYFMRLAAKASPPGSIHIHDRETSLAPATSTRYPDSTTSAYFTRLVEKASPPGSIHIHDRESSYSSIRYVETTRAGRPAVGEEVITIRKNRS